MTAEEWWRGTDEWLTATEPGPLLAFVRGKTRERKLRLFAVACCRRIWPLMPNDQYRRAVEVAEQYAEGSTDYQPLQRAIDEAVCFQGRRPAPHAVWRAGFAARNAANKAPGGWVASNCLYEAARAANVRDTNHPDPAELQHQVSILRCLCGNPFRPTPVNPAWLTLNVRQLAVTIYEERVYDRLPILADALLDAGCDHADVLNHCRQPGEHVRGCWVVDQLLGKS